MAQNKDKSMNLKSAGNKNDPDIHNDQLGENSSGTERADEVYKKEHTKKSK